MADDYITLPDHDFGFSTIEHHDPTVLARQQDRIAEIKKLVIPLIDNLMKDPQKDIHWPNRDKKLKDFKSKFLKLCDN